jgi:hypothetical protein
METKPHEFSSGQPPDRGAEPGSVHAILLRYSTSVSRQTLTSIIKEAQDGVEPGLRIIDSCIPCHPYGEMDFLALDRMNQLTIIDFDIAPNDGLLMRGIGHFDWAFHNLFSLRRMYGGETLNSLAEPRLLLLAPDFSTLMASAVRHIARPRIERIKYRLVEASGILGIVFERVSACSI